ncbi:NAD-dependent dehydratase [Vibrio sp. UCD-FRSSP16_10]|uniref:UDP-glucose 4-epimerase family protein n=1 Tax=unclassified Vibrio TaxID=2614977 RepID=UPI0007FF2E69|nr:MULTISPECIES: SDR family oxidoreductase [unclassified Vibrio]OBT13658.1 NAD-dependent dehydratase [Vibrio sp. UCD-FRSSP16_30]OBT19212.1 NAD-dependent dehydratase [Vibrio sp. UCD-FRSSP16_10]
MRLFVTGVTGFVGHRVSYLACKDGYQVIGQSRSQSTQNRINHFSADINPITNWDSAFKEVDCVVHCAARVHQMSGPLDQIESLYDEVNHLGTINLAKQAAAQGVKRFVFLSSIKVNGESTVLERPFIVKHSCTPTDPYGVSKWKAEQALKQVSKDTGMEVVIIRPPLVYGPGVKANFKSLLNWIDKGIPLPLGAINNQRSMVYLDNLVHLILECCYNPKAANETFLVSDDYDISTSVLLRQVAKSMRKSNRMLPIPEFWLKLGLRLVGKEAVGLRLCSSLQLDISHTKKRLNWTPPISFAQGVQMTVDAYLEDKNDIGRCK